MGKIFSITKAKKICFTVILAGGWMTLFFVSLFGVLKNPGISIPTDYFENVQSLGFVSKDAQIYPRENNSKQLLIEWVQMEPEKTHFYISGDRIDISKHDARRIQMDIVIGGAYNQGNKSDNYIVTLYLRSFSSDGTVLDSASIPILLSSKVERSRLYSISIPIAENAISYQCLIRIGRKDTAIMSGYLSIESLDLIEK